MSCKITLLSNTEVTPAQHSYCWTEKVHLGLRSGSGWVTISCVLCDDGEIVCTRLWHRWLKKQVVSQLELTKLQILQVGGKAVKVVLNC